MNRNEKLQAITTLIEMGRTASKLIDDCTDAIRSILDGEENDTHWQDAMFPIASDPSAAEYAKFYLRELEKGDL